MIANKDIKTKEKELRDLLGFHDPYRDPLKRIYCPKCGDNSSCYLGKGNFQCLSCNTKFTLEEMDNG